MDYFRRVESRSLAWQRVAIPRKQFPHGQCEPPLVSQCLRLAPRAGFVQNERAHAQLAVTTCWRDRVVARNLEAGGLVAEQCMS